MTNASYIAVAAVPEMGSWGMMIVGIGAIGFAMRHRIRASEVRFSARIKRIAAGEAIAWPIVASVRQSR